MKNAYNIRVTQDADTSNSITAELKWRLLLPAFGHSIKWNKRCSLLPNTVVRRFRIYDLF